MGALLPHLLRPPAGRCQAPLAPARRHQQARSVSGPSSFQEGVGQDSSGASVSGPTGSGPPSSTIRVGFQALKIPGRFRACLSQTGPKPTRNFEEGVPSSTRCGASARPASVHPASIRASGPCPSVRYPSSVVRPSRRPSVVHPSIAPSVRFVVFRSLLERAIWSAFDAMGMDMLGGTPPSESDMGRVPLNSCPGVDSFTDMMVVMMLLLVIVIMMMAIVVVMMVMAAVVRMMVVVVGAVMMMLARRSVVGMVMMMIARRPAVRSARSVRLVRPVRPVCAVRPVRMMIMLLLMMMMMMRMMMTMMRMMMTMMRMTIRFHI